MKAGAGSLEAEKMDVKDIEVSVGVGSFSYEGKAPEELEAALAQVTLDQVIQIAQGVQLDSVYTLRNKEG